MSSLATLVVILLLTIVAPLFIVLHFVTKWKQGREISGDDEQMLVEDTREMLKSQADEHPAYQHYLEGCKLDEEEGTFAQAEQAYRRAIELDRVQHGNVRARADLHHASDIACRDHVRLFGFQRFDLTVLQLSRNLGLHQVVSSRAAAAQVTIQRL